MTDRPGLPQTLDYAVSSARVRYSRRRGDNLLLNRNFVLLWAAYGISALGDHLSETALLRWQHAMESFTGDITRRSAVMTFVFMAPFVLLGPLFGALSDRVPRRLIMVAADLIRCVIMFEMFRILTALQHWVQPGFDPVHDPLHLGVAVIPLIGMGVFAAGFSPARMAFLPTLIRPEQFVRANALTSSLGIVATIASALLGGWLAQHYSPNVNFRLDALTFVGSAACLLMIRQSQAHVAAASSDHGLSAVSAGFKYVRRHHLAWEIIAVATVFWMAAGIVRSIIPALVRDVFQGDYVDVGTFQGLIGVGIVLGSIALTIIGPALKSPLAISWSLKLAGVSGLFLSAGIFFHLPKAFCGTALVFIGLFGAGISVSVGAMLQRLVPNHMRGRVFGVHDLFTMSGLLLVTGLLGIPQWDRIDRYIGWIMLGASLMLLGFGVWTTMLRLGRGRWSRGITFWVNLSDFYCRFWGRLRRVGICTVPYDGPVIVAANHNSTLDPFVLNAACPNRYISYMIAAEYARIPLFARLVKTVGCIPVNRSGVDTASVKAALRHLADGKCLGIFPQGGVVRPDAEPRVREGVGLLALRSGAKVIPAYIDGITYSDGVIGPLLRRQHARVRFGPPVDLSAFVGREKDREAYREAADAILRAILGLREAQAGLGTPREAAPDPR